MPLGIGMAETTPPKSLFLKDLSYKPFKPKNLAGISSNPMIPIGDGG
jgi:hypothetical protein